MSAIEPSTQLLPHGSTAAAALATPVSLSNTSKPAIESKPRTLMTLPGEILTMIVSFVVEADFNNEFATVDAPQTRKLLKTSGLLRRIAIHNYWRTFLHRRVIGAWTCEMTDDDRVHDWVQANHGVQMQRLWDSPWMSPLQKRRFHLASMSDNGSLCPSEWRPWMHRYDEPAWSPVMSFSCWNARLADVAGIRMGGFSASLDGVFIVCDILDYLWVWRPDVTGDTEEEHQSNSDARLFRMITASVARRKEEKAREKRRQEEEKSCSTDDKLRLVSTS